MSQPQLVLTQDAAHSLLKRIAASPRVIYDVETDGLDWRQNKIVGHVCTLGPAPQDTYYVPVRHGPDHKTGNLIVHPDRFGHPFEQALNQIATDYTSKKWVGHHFLFDMMMCHGHDIHFSGLLEDTEVNDALIDEYAGSHSLEAACIRAGTQAKKGDELYGYLAGKFGGKADRRTQMGSYWKLAGDDPIGFDYAAGDGVATWHLYEKQLEVCLNQDLDDIRQLESKVTRTVYRMMKRGIRIDIAALEESIETTEIKLKVAREYLPSDLNINSGPQLERFFTERGVTDFPRTAIGNPSFTKEWLPTSKPGRAVMAVRQLGHLLNSFQYPLRDTHLFQGRVYATYHQMANDDYGTITGRFSCSGPNLQQNHKRDKEMGKLSRRPFIPDDGLDWVDSDLSQCEPRLLAHYSQSKVLLSGYLSKPSVDAHTAVAVAAAIDRESGKRLNQTLITGGGKGKIIAMLGARGAQIYSAYFEAMPEVKALQNTASKRLLQRGFIISLKGRKARLESHDKGYLAINRLLQCGNADIIKEAMVRIDAHFEENGDECAILNTVHDALGMQGNMSDVSHKTQIMEALRLMTDYGPDDNYGTYLSVPMAADYGVGKNWAEATYPDDKLTFERDAVYEAIDET